MALYHDSLDNPVPHQTVMHALIVTIILTTIFSFLFHLLFNSSTLYDPMLQMHLDSYILNQPNNLLPRFLTPAS